MNRLFACLAVPPAGSLLAQTRAEDMFPFVIPGLVAPSAGSVVDVSWLNDPPAGGHGFVRARDGHFVDGRGKRLRFLASNFTFGSCFPGHDTADKLAARLASLGLNCIRFHHTDNQVAPGGIWKAGTPKKNQFDPAQFDRLDYFISALKRHGIYADLNLHISRNYWEGEDFPDGLAGDRERQGSFFTVALGSRLRHRRCSPSFHPCNRLGFKSTRSLESTFYWLFPLLPMKSSMIPRCRAGDDNGICAGYIKPCGAGRGDFTLFHPLPPGHQAAAVCRSCRP